MPLQKGSSQKIISKNIEELNTTKPSPKRMKAIRTLAKRRGISYSKAKQILSEKIAYSIAGKNKKSKGRTRKFKPIKIK